MTYQLDELKDAVISLASNVNSLNSDLGASQDKTRYDTNMCCNVYTQLCVYIYIQYFD
jgi:hypothetical protein